MSIVQRASAQSRGTVAPVAEFWPRSCTGVAQASVTHASMDAQAHPWGMFCAIAEERIRGDYATKCRELTVTYIYIYKGEMTTRRDYLPRLTARQ